MITFRTKITFNAYFTANLHRILDRPFEIGLLIILFLSFLATLFSGDFFYSMLAIAIPLFINILFPFIRFLYAKYHFKAQEIEYFFDSKAVGFKMEEYKMEVKRDSIKKIKFRGNCIIILLEKGILHFIVDKEMFKKIKEALLTSDFKKHLI